MKSLSNRAWLNLGHVLMLIGLFFIGCVESVPLRFTPLDWQFVQDGSIQDGKLADQMLIDQNGWVMRDMKTMRDQNLNDQVIGGDHLIDQNF